MEVTIVVIISRGRWPAQLHASYLFTNGVNKLLRLGDCPGSLPARTLRVSGSELLRLRKRIRDASLSPPLQFDHNGLHRVLAEHEQWVSRVMPGDPLYDRHTIECGVAWERAVGAMLQSQSPRIWTFTTPCETADSTARIFYSYYLAVTYYFSSSPTYESIFRRDNPWSKIWNSQLSNCNIGCFIKRALIGFTFSHMSDDIYMRVTWEWTATSNYIGRRWVHKARHFGQPSKRYEYFVCVTVIWRGW